MAINYAPVTNLIDTSFRAGTIATSAGPRRGVFYPNGSSSYLFVPCVNATLSGGGVCNFWRFDPTGSLPSSTTAVFNTFSGCTSVFFYSNGANSLLFSTDRTAGKISVFKFDPSSVSSTITTKYAEYAAGTQPRNCVYAQNVAGTTGYLFISTGDTTGTVRFYKINLVGGADAGVFSTPTATFNAGSTSVEIAFYYNGATSYLVSADNTTNVISVWEINPDTISSTITTTSRKATYAVASLNGLAFYYNGSSSYFFGVNAGDNTIRFYRANPATAQTLSTATATFATGGLTPNLVKFIPNGSNSYLLVTNGASNTCAYWKFDPSTVSTTNIAATALIDTGTLPTGAECQIVSNVAYTYISDLSSNQISVYRTDFNDRAIDLSASPRVPLSSTGAVRKASGGTLTQYSAGDFFQISQQLRAGASISGSGLGNTVYGYAYTTTSDTTGTIGENYTLSGASTEITGNYRLTMGAGTTLTLANKGIYNDSFTVPSTGTLALTANTTLGSSFILSAGTTVTGSGYTLTLPYVDPGLVLGSGVTLVAPTIKVSAPNFADGTRVQVAHRQVFTALASAINTTTNAITLGNDSNGDAPSFSTSPRTLVRFTLADGATLPTTSPQIEDFGLYYADLSGSALSLRITSSGGAIDFSSQGSGSFTLTAETEIANSVVSGGAGYSLTLTRSNNALIRIKAVHWSVSGGIASCSEFYDEVFAWSAIAGIPVIDVVDNTVAASQDSIHERLVAETTLTLEGEIRDASGAKISSITLPDDGSMVSGLAFALEGVGKIQVNADDANGILSWQELYLWGCWVRSTSAGIRLASATTFVAINIFNYTISNLEFDNISSTQLKIVGGIGRSADGSDMIAAGSGSIIPNAVSQGTGAEVSVSGSGGLTSAQDAKLTAIDAKVATLENGLTSSQATTLNGINTAIAALYNGLTPTQATQLSAIQTAVGSLYNGLTTEQVTTLNAINTALAALYNGLTPSQATTLAAIQTAVGSLYNGLTPAQETKLDAIQTQANSLYNGLTPSQASALAALYNGLTPEESAVLAAIHTAVGSLYNGLTPSQATQVSAIETLANAIRTNQVLRDKCIGLIAGVSASQKPPTEGTPGYLTTSDGAVNQTLTLVDGEITISRTV